MLLSNTSNSAIRRNGESTARIRASAPVDRADVYALPSNFQERAEPCYLERSEPCYRAVSPVESIAASLHDAEPCEDIPPVNRTLEALTNEDILHSIFEHFDLIPGSKTIVQTRKDLLCAAKVCKSFAGPALNSLWRVLPSLLPLLLLLPSAEVANGQYFIDSLPSDNWERFEEHARRVRTLYMEAQRVVISPAIYLRIRSMRDGPWKGGYVPEQVAGSRECGQIAVRSRL